MGLENTGNFVEEQLIDLGENTASNIELTGQLVDGATKSIVGQITKNDELKRNGSEELNEVQTNFAAVQVKKLTEKVQDVTKIGTGLYSGDMRQAKDGATGLIGLKKSAVGLNVLDDFITVKKQ